MAACITDEACDNVLLHNFERHSLQREGKKHWLVSARILPMMLVYFASGVGAEGALLPEVLVRDARLPDLPRPVSHWGNMLPVHEIPQSVSVLDDGDIGQLAPARLEDIIGVVPGAQPGVLNAGLSTAVMVRGFAVTRMRWNGLPDIQRLFVRDLHTVERVEVLRGPEAVLEGITSPGGVVRYRGKVPQFTARHRVGVDVGEHGWQGATIDSTGPLGDRFAYRLVGAFQDGRTRPGNFTERRDHALAGLAWRYHDDGQLRVESEYQRNARPYLFGTVRTAEQGVMYDRLYASPEQRTRRTYERHGLAWEHAVHEQLTFAADYSRAKVGRDETLIGFWSIRNADSLWGYYTRYRDRYTQANLRLEARLAFETAGLAHRLVLGRDDNRQHIDFGGVQNIAGFTVDIAAPDFSTVDPSSLPVTRRFNHEHYRDRAWYAGLRSSLGDVAHLTLGLRDSDYQISADRTGAGLIPAAEAGAPTWHAGLVLRLANGLHGHAALGTGIEPNRGFTRTGDFLPPQHSRQIEVGLRWSPVAALDMTAALWRTRLDNLPMVDPLDRTALVSTGSRQVEGMEFSTTVNRGTWRWQANATWMDSRNLSKTFNGQGDAFVNVPRFSASLRVGHEFSIPGAQPLHLWLAGVLVGKRYGDAANSFEVPAYRRWDLGGEYALARATRVRFGVRNLTDKRYVEAITNASDVYQGPRRHTWIGLVHEL